MVWQEIESVKIGLNSVKIYKYAYYYIKNMKENKGLLEETYNSRYSKNDLYKILNVMDTDFLEEQVQDDPNSMYIIIHDIIQDNIDLIDAYNNLQNKMQSMIHIADKLYKENKRLNKEIKKLTGN